MSNPEIIIINAILLLANVGTGIRCSLLSAPSNNVVVANQRMDMECRTTNGSIVREWKRERNSDKRTDSLFFNWDTAKSETNPQIPQFGVRVDGSGSGFVYSNSTELEDAGIYTCVFQDNSRLQKFSAYLIVLESPPVCKSNSTASVDNAAIVNLWVQCSVNYTGCLAPTVVWKRHDGERATRGGGAELLREIRTVVIPHSRITYTLTTDVKLRNGVNSIFLQIYFSWPNCSLSVNATNTPHYEHAWTKTYYFSEYTEGLQSTEFTKWPEESGINKSTIPLSTSTISAPENGKYSLLLWLVVTMATIIAFMVITAIVCFLRFRSIKAKHQLNVTSSSESHETFEILPGAIGDAYDQIDELKISDESTTDTPKTTNVLPKRTDLLPTLPGYSGLTSQEQIGPITAYYCRMKKPPGPVEETEESEMKLYILEKVPGRETAAERAFQCASNYENSKSNAHEIGSNVYLSPIGDGPTEDTHSDDVNASYLELSVEDD